MFKNLSVDTNRAVSIMYVCLCAYLCLCAKKDTLKMALNLFIVLNLLISRAFFFFFF